MVSFFTKIQFDYFHVICKLVMEKSLFLLWPYYIKSEFLNWNHNFTLKSSYSISKFENSNRNWRKTGIWLYFGTSLQFKDAVRSIFWKLD